MEAWEELGIGCCGGGGGVGGDSWQKWLSVCSESAEEAEEEEAAEARVEEQAEQEQRLDLQLLDSAPLSLQKLLLALDDVVELQEVLHGPVRALGARMSIHDFSGLRTSPKERLHGQK
ncbi:hypothetical protein EYF80_033193 [Liparis tanakae]|uniref:Uncharacterized protein n=1 Tax=Liparis tanakae TaxID=230148 RepID=A0A4Z2GT27_9TELE|nr:hypothetical protein EYF80_033193 [Liparis tanakae]